MTCFGFEHCHFWFRSHRPSYTRNMFNVQSINNYSISKNGQKTHSHNNWYIQAFDSLVWWIVIPSYVHITLPIGSMYGIYANILGILMVNVNIYSIHWSYGLYTPNISHGLPKGIKTHRFRFPKMHPKSSIDHELIMSYPLVMSK